MTDKKVPRLTYVIEYSGEVDELDLRAALEHMQETGSARVIDIYVETRKEDTK